MKILVPLPFDISCLQHGRNLRIVHLLRELAGRHEVTCAVSDRRLERAARSVLADVEVAAAPDWIDPRKAALAMMNDSVLMRKAADYFGYDPSLRSWTDCLCGRAEVVLGFDLPSAIYVTPIGRTGERTIPTICDLIDDPWLTYRSLPCGARWSLAGMKNAIGLRVMRRRLLSRVDLLMAVAPPDAQALFRATGRPVHVVPNGVVIPEPAVATRSDEKLVVFTGAMNFAPNERAADYLVRSIWPQVRRLIPQARLALVGANPTPAVASLARESGVHVTGRVPDLGAWLRCARVAVAPMLSGTGIKNKVLEACANGCPVIATSKAVTGIPAGQENGILVADSTRDFAAQIVRLFINTSLADQLGHSALRMVREHFTWSRAADLFEAAIDAGVAGRRVTTRHATQSHNSDAGHALDRLVSHPAMRKEASHAVS